MNLLNEKIHTIDKFYMMGKFQKTLFRGNLKNNKPDGFGIHFSFDDVYIGNFRNGYKHGYGILKCKEGYKIIRNKFGKYLRKGLYIGYFYKDVFITGKCILKDNDDICILSVKKKMNNGLCIRKNPFSYVKTFHKENSPIVSYRYENFHLNILIESFLKNNLFHGYCFKKFENHYEILYYDNGKVKGKSIYHIFKNNITFVFEWKKGFRHQILKIIDKGNRLYYPETILKNIPLEYLCPIGYNIMLEPCMNEKNQIYDLKNISNWYFNYKKRTDPLTNLQLKFFHITHMENLQKEIFTYIYKNLFFKKNNNLYLI